MFQVHIKDGFFSIIVSKNRSRNSIPDEWFMAISDINIR